MAFDCRCCSLLRRLHGLACWLAGYQKSRPTSIVETNTHNQKAATLSVRQTRAQKVTDCQSVRASRRLCVTRPPTKTEYIASHVVFGDGLRLRRQTRRRARRQAGGRSGGLVDVRRTERLRNRKTENKILKRSEERPTGRPTSQRASREAASRRDKRASDGATHRQASEHSVGATALTLFNTGVEVCLVCVSECAFVCAHACNTRRLPAGKDAVPPLWRIAVVINAAPPSCRT